MKLTQALRLAHKKGQGPTILTKTNSKRFWVCEEPYPGGKNDWVSCAIFPQADFQDDWTRGFAWIQKEDQAVGLTVHWPSMNEYEWNLMDASMAPILNHRPDERLFSLGNDNFDNNVVQGCLNRIEKDNHDLFVQINEELKPLGFSLQLVSRPFHKVISLIAPAGATLLDRMVATAVVVGVIKKFDENIANSKEKALFDAWAPLGPICVAKVDMEEFTRRIRTSRRLWLIQLWLAEDRKKGVRATWSMTPSRVTLAKYSGGHSDRLAERNQLTNFIGMPNASGMSCWSVDDARGFSGTFLADVVRRYGANGYVLMDDNVILDLQHDLNMDGGGCGYSSLSPTTPQDYSALKHAVRKRLVSFESYQAPNA